MPISHINCQSYMSLHVCKLHSQYSTTRVTRGSRGKQFACGGVTCCYNRRHGQDEKIQTPVLRNFHIDFLLSGSSDLKAQHDVY
jgi:hypothetical protein